MPIAQINARIDADKIALGDLALAEIGWAPTRAIAELPPNNITRLSYL